MSLLQFPANRMTTAQPLGNAKSLLFTKEFNVERGERAELHCLLDEILDDRNHALGRVRANAEFAIETIKGKPGYGSGVIGCNRRLKAEL